MQAALGLQHLTDPGVCGVRSPMLPVASLQWPHLDVVAARVRDFGWHVQVPRKGWESLQRAPQPRRLPQDTVVDPLAKYLDPTPPPDAVMLDQLLAWADDEAARRRILADNPAALYGFPPALPLPP